MEAGRTDRRDLLSFVSTMRDDSEEEEECASKLNARQENCFCDILATNRAISYPAALRKESLFSHKRPRGRSQEIASRRRTHKRKGRWKLQHRISIARYIHQDDESLYLFGIETRMSCEETRILWMSSI